MKVMMSGGPVIVVNTEANEKEREKDCLIYTSDLTSDNSYSPS